MTRRALLLLSVLFFALGAAGVALAQARTASPPPGLVEQARAVARDRLHLSIESASGSVDANVLGAVRRDRAPGGRYAFFPGQAEFGTIEGDELEPVWVVHLARPRMAGTEGAVVVFDAGGHAVAGWELFSPD